MPEADEMMEQMEHAGKGGGLGKKIGITMAVLGVLLALCSALVGGSRTELIAKMVEQTGASLKYQTVSTKYRMIEANLVQLHSLLPDPKVFKANAVKIDGLSKGFAKGAVPERQNELLDLEVSQILTTVTPTHSDMMSFVTQLRALDVQAEAAEAWAESYEGAIQAHSQAAEHYEWAQLCSEVGIVVCSVALLMSNKPGWLVSVCLGVVCILIVGVTFAQVSEQLSTSGQKIAACEQKYTDLSKDDKSGDEELFKQIEQEGPAGESAATPEPAGASH